MSMNKRNVAATADSVFLYLFLEAAEVLGRDIEIGGQHPVGHGL